MSIGGFTDQELEILNIAYQTFITKEFNLKTFEEKWPKAGFEAWVVGELLIQFEIRGMNPQKTQKPDLIINDLKIEVKGCAHTKNARDAGWLIDDYIKHPDQDLLHLWVFSKANILEHLESFFVHNAIIHDEVDLGESGWMVMISKQTEGTPDPIIKLSYRAWRARDGYEVEIHDHSLFDHINHVRRYFRARDLSRTSPLQPRRKTPSGILITWIRLRKLFVTVIHTRALNPSQPSKHARIRVLGYHLSYVKLKY